VKARGLGRVYRRTYRDKRTGEQRETNTWWIEYSHRGKKVRESSGSSLRRDASALLKRRLTRRGAKPGKDIEKTTFEELAEMLLNDYKVNGRRSLKRVEGSMKHLLAFFSDQRAIDITTDRVLAYVALRQDEEAKNATINRELAALKRLLRLGKQAEKCDDVPHIAMLRENNTRKGFFDREQFEDVVRHLPIDVRPVVQIAYVTGWRVTAEILTRQWQHVDFKNGWLRLEPGETKNNKGRNFPLTDELREILGHQRTRTKALEQARGEIIPWVFHRDGDRIRYFQRSWKTACKNAGVPGRLLHDFRRTAVRNLERAGVPRSDAKEMVGHQTDSVYNRYAISDSASLKESARKLSQFHQREGSGQASTF